VVAHQEGFCGSDFNAAWSRALPVFAGRADRVEKPEQLLVVRRDQPDLPRSSRKCLQRGSASVFGADRLQCVLQPALDRRVVVADSVWPVPLLKLVVSFAEFFQRRRPTESLQCFFASLRAKP
jgi:hypothetical protein